MNSSAPNGRTPAYYTVREAAWILGVNPSKIWRAIRTGSLPTTRRRAQVVIPAPALARLLGEPDNAGPPAATGQDGGDAR